MTVSRLFEDYFFYNPENLVQTLCDRIAQDGVENVRSEALRRLEAGTLPLGLGAPLFSCFGVEPIVDDLRRLLLRPSSTDETRLIAYAALANANVDLIRELDPLDADAKRALIPKLRQLKEALAVARGGGGPFRGLLKTDPGDEAAVEEQVSSIVQPFLQSTQAAELPDPQAAGWWIQHLLVLAYSSDLGTPLTMTGADVEDVLSELMPPKVMVESEEQVLPAISAFRAFFHWVAEVTKMPAQEDVFQVLSALEPYFPEMMLDGGRFGPRKGFIMAGLNAGFDMSTVDGLEAFASQWKRERASAGARAPALTAQKKKELAAAKKRKAKMEKASRKKNRRKK